MENQSILAIFEILNIHIIISWCLVKKLTLSWVLICMSITLQKVISKNKTKNIQNNLDSSVTYMKILSRLSMNSFYNQLGAIIFFIVTNSINHQRHGLIIISTSSKHTALSTYVGFWSVELKYVCIIPIRWVVIQYYQLGVWSSTVLL